ncbi:MarR family transcriptional regulator [Streptomyces coacervatus]|uniref:MarR family transcriptional regulator n=1 Tax=Streptomyces coacervatus TaxID=647381 RepID=A0ABP7IVU3_9ACTN|nr:MarR family transcriptional regulator [Streptomyces coacervatus]MDF2269714.1 MarR family transcriptional regulator [Streptomyces coacervatus]
MEPTPQHVAAYFALMEAGALLQQLVEQQLRRDGDLSYIQFRVLAQLAEAPEQSLRMTDLADGVVYSRSGLTYQADRLEQGGLIARSPSPDDERSVTVTMTEAGREALERVLPGHIDLVAKELFGPLKEPDVTAMADVLTRVRDHLRTVPRGPATRRRPAAN